MEKGWLWSMEPCEVFEIVFESPEDFWAIEPMDIRGDTIAYRDAFPCAVYLLLADGERAELMRTKRS